MKRFSLLTLTFLLTSCGGPSIAVDPTVLDEQPRLEEVVTAWGDVLSTVEDGDCTAFLEHMRSSLGLTEADCSAAFAYLKNPPEIDWARSEWTADEGKVKLYEVGKGSLVSLEYDGRDERWELNSAFWAE